MLRLIAIEFFKLRNTRYFWVLFGCFLLFLLSVPIAAKALQGFLASEGENIFGLQPEELPFFDFVDIWQNITWIYKSCSLLLGFIIVISMSNEFNFGTIKQHIIDGMSRRGLLHSKVLLIVGLSFFVSLIVLMIGLIMGYLWSPVKAFPFVIAHIEFVPAYFLHLVAFMLFCLVISLLIKRAGMVIAFLTFYVYVIEIIITSILEYKYELPLLADLFPVRAIGNIIPFPFGKYALQYSQNFVGWDDLGILLAYTFLLYLLAHRLMVKRDLV